MESKLKEYAEVLDKVLKKYNIPEECYSIGEYSEEAVCLERNTEGWMVYEGERGRKYNIKVHSNVQNACFDIISRIVTSDEEEKGLRNYWKLMMKTEF